MRKIKKDRFLKSRDGTFQILDIICAIFGQTVLIYQKDGRGTLHRVYLNRILAPEKLASLQDKTESKEPLLNLKCPCGALIGVPMLHWEGRLAFRLNLGSYKKKQHKEKQK